MNKTITKRSEPRAAIMEVLRHPTVQFVQALDQLKEEHERLRSKLSEFPAFEQSIREGKTNTDWYGALRDLRNRVKAFMEQLAQHAEWEDRALFPMVALYAEDNASVLEVLEEDHRLAVQYMEAFLNELRRLVSPIQQADAIRIMELLMNAHQLLLQHFKGEEQWIYPIADEILEDIDYLSC